MKNVAAFQTRSFVGPRTKRSAARHHGVAGRQPAADLTGFCALRPIILVMFINRDPAEGLRRLPNERS